MVIGASEGLCNSNVSKEIRKNLQKLKGEKVTESGVSKGKDIKK